MASSSSSYSLAAILLLTLAAAALSAHPRHDASPPAADCSSLVLTMADCLSFVSNGSTVDKPEGTCCAGLKTVLKTDAACLCEALRSSAQLGVVLNVSKAMTLPSACKVPAASAAKCSLSITPAASPPGGEAPASSPTIATAPTKSELRAPPAAKNSATATSPVMATYAVVAAAVAASYWLFI
ncbi:hypothetical protein MLD38_026916 [Melastoma candidum]|uniref:Uncharacterized protein n=1 Tax=Melastoma candidum TaxID=119954 RepID=A0ACB9P392_9MYRT|nr:hypothetical protein MLD38_026916 [Melastoma candidum]